MDVLFSVFVMVAIIVITGTLTRFYFKNKKIKETQKKVDEYKRRIKNRKEEHKLW